MQRSKLDLYEGQGFIVLNDPSYEDGALVCVDPKNAGDLVTTEQYVEVGGDGDC